MFDQLRVDVLERFAAVEAYFRTSRGLNREMGQIARGLAFVHMYAAYEFTVCTVMQHAIDTIVLHGHPYNDLSPSLMALFLNPQLQAIRDCRSLKTWDKRLNLFEKAFSSDPATVANTVFPVCGDQFKHEHLQMIFNILGITRLPARRNSHLRRIDEVVDHRNAIAHGRETAENIGRRYTRDEVHSAIRQMKSVCELVIIAIKEHCSDASRHCRG